MILANPLLTPCNAAAAAAAAAANSLTSSSASLAVRDSRWLQLDICSQFKAGLCKDDECPLAHPPPNVKIEGDQVTVCYDYIKRKDCKHGNCKYFHPPQHLVDSVLRRGDENKKIMENQQIFRTRNLIPFQHTLWPTAAANHAASLHPFFNAHAAAAYPSLFATAAPGPSPGTLPPGFGLAQLGQSPATMSFVSPFTNSLTMAAAAAAAAGCGHQAAQTGLDMSMMHNGQAFTANAAAAAAAALAANPTAAMTHLGQFAAAMTARPTLKRPAPEIDPATATWMQMWSQTAKRPTLNPSGTCEMSLEETCGGTASAPSSSSSASIPSACGAAGTRLTPPPQAGASASTGMSQHVAAAAAAASMYGYNPHLSPAPSLPYSAATVAGTPVTSHQAAMAAAVNNFLMSSAATGSPSHPLFLQPILRSQAAAHGPPTPTGPTSPAFLQHFSAPSVNPAGAAADSPANLATLVGLTDARGLALSQGAFTTSTVNPITNVAYINDKGQLLETLPICRDFKAGKCHRNSDCRYVHLLDDNVEVNQGRVVVCRDAAKGRCNRVPCKYFHIPFVALPATKNLVLSTGLSI